ncbi:hypothetical protein HKX48_007266 [Thoreauomyces humboldtii]|nr:hypothetical protein HKX48_007266 [Thoreauomyces humboldtii]
MDVTEKLDHPLAEVRRRALDSLKLKIKTGILSPESVAYDQDILRKLVGTLQSDTSVTPDARIVLGLLDDLCLHASARSNLAALGIQSALTTLGARAPADDAVLIDALRQKLLRVDLAVELLPKLPAISTRIPRPRRSRSPQKSPVRFSRPASRTQDNTERYAHGDSGSTLPYLPNALRSYDALELSTDDEQIINEFCVQFGHMDGGEIMREVLLDYGGCVVLQRSNWFKTILDHVRNHPVDENIRCMILLVQDWESHFRRVQETPLPCYSTHASRASNISRSSNGNTAVAVHGSIMSDYAISSPFACNEIFSTLVPALRNVGKAPLILELLYNVLPLLKLHLSMGLQQAYHTTPEATLSSYVFPVLEALDHDGRDSLYASKNHDAKTVECRERLVVFAMDILLSLAPLAHDASAFWAALIPRFAGTARLNGVPGTLVHWLLREPGSPSNDKMISNLLQHVKPWVRSAALEQLEGYLANNDLPRERLSASVSIVDALMRSIMETEEASELESSAYRLARNLLENQTDNFLWAILPRIRAAYSIDNGALMQSALDALRVERLDDLYRFWAIALLHSNANLREAAVQALCALVSSFPSGASPQDLSEPGKALIVPPSLLTVLEAPPEHTGEHTGELNERSILERLISGMEVRPRDYPALTVDLRCATDRIHDPRSQACALSLGFADTLCKELTADNPWIDVPGVLPRILKILRTLAESDKPWRPEPTFFAAVVPHLFHPDTQVRYEIARILSTVCFLDSTNNQKSTETYHLYGPALAKLKLRKPDCSDWLGTEHGLELLKDYRQTMMLPKAERTLLSPYTSGALRKVNVIMHELHGSKSHAEFETGLARLKSSISCPKDLSLFDAELLMKTFTKIITTAPANSEDTALLIDVLEVLEIILKDVAHFEAFSVISVPCFKRMIVPVLRSWLHGSNSQLPSHLVARVLAFAATAVTNLATNYLSQLVVKADLLPLLADCASFVLKLDDPGSLHLSAIIDILSACVSVPSLASLVTTEVVGETVALLVNIVTRHQALRGHAQYDSEYIGRGTYTRAALALRIVSRTSYTATSGDSRSTQWLHDGSLRWLVALLDDPQPGVQKCGMGVLSNLLMVTDVRQILQEEIPRHFEVALRSIVDDGIDIGIRKEALLLVKNYLVCTRDAERRNASTGTESKPDIQEALRMIEDSGLFNALSSLCATECRQNVSELLLCIATVSGDSLIKVLIELNVWEDLIASLGSRPELLDPDIQGAGATFAARQSRNIHWRSDANSICNVLGIILVLAKDKADLKAYLLERTNLLTSILHVMRTGWAWAMESSNPATEDKQTSAHRLLEMGTRVLSEMTLTCATRFPASLEAAFREQETGLAVFRMLCWFLDSRSRDDAAVGGRRTACILLSRLLSVHCGMVADLGLSEVLVGTSAMGSENSIGLVLCDALVAVLFRSYEVDDPIYMEAVRLALQSLLGCCEFVKRHALKTGIIEAFVKRTTSIVATSVDNLYQILNRPESSDLLILETLGCLRNLFANCNSTKRLAFEILPSRSGLQTTSIGVMLVAIARRKITKLDAFRACFEVLKILGLSSECRGIMWKSNLGTSVVTLLDSLCKAKEVVKMEAVLEFLCNCTYATDGQLNVMRTEGAFDLLVEIVRGRAPPPGKRIAVQILRNLAMAKENKPHFLLSEAFPPMLGELLSSRTLEVLCPATAMIRALLYESEKGKVALRNGTHVVTLDALSRRFQTGECPLPELSPNPRAGESVELTMMLDVLAEYASVLNREGSEENAADPSVPNSDLVLVREIVENLEIVQKALKS